MNNFEALLEWMEEGQMDELLQPQAKDADEYGYSDRKRAPGVTKRKIHQSKMKDKRFYDVSGEDLKRERKAEIKTKKTNVDAARHKRKIGQGPRGTKSPGYDAKYHKVHKDQMQGNRMNKAVDKKRAADRVGHV